MGEKNPFVPIRVKCKLPPLIPEGEIRIIYYRGQPPVIAYHVSQAQIEALLEWYEARRKAYSPWTRKRRERGFDALEEEGYRGDYKKPYEDTSLLPADNRSSVRAAVGV
ncbi:MAG: hypothetical protein L5656_06800 [Thermanaeromonas sp.]|uniref:hypothetical protein n=1 Tax=Thermanaeromonas sp. TaxID=2003697 RepID=UPI00243EA343|nr:hypothetical protein [Thermanaeromonas sp.]MCG0278225.1 hypothetical protein [Thermanaeromonas sp.]